MSFTTNTTTVLETTEPRARSVVLSLLTALSTSFPVVGLEGEGAVSKQLSDLLQAKTVPLSELSLLYCYKFGFGLADALKYIGFKGNVQEFLQQNTAVALSNGLVSVRPDKHVSHPNAWHRVGSRIAAAFHDASDEETDEKMSFTANSAASLSAQLSEMLEDKTVSVSELSLLYCYKFGRSISEALTAVGFKGKLEDFLQQHKFAVIDNGLVSLCPKACNSKLKTVNENSNADDQSTTGAESSEGDIDTDTNVTNDEVDTLINPSAWHNVGSRIACAFKDIDEDELFPSTSYISTASPNDGDDGYEADEDTGPLPNAVAWADVGRRFAVALEDVCEEDAPNPAAWCRAGSRIASALKTVSEDSDDEGEVSQESPDPAAWCNVGSRIATALNDVADDELGGHPNPAGWCNVSSRIAAAVADMSEDDPYAWRNVGCRMATALKDSDEEDVINPDAINPSAWSDVGSRLRAAFADSEDQISEGDSSDDA